AIVAEGNRARTYLPATEDAASAASCECPRDIPDTELPDQALGLRVQAYGLRRHRDLFTNRQLVALSTFSSIIEEIGQKVNEDCSELGWSPKQTQGYVQAIATYLAFTISKAADYWSTLCVWHSGASHQKVANTFARQTLSMTVDFAEANPFSHSSGHF